MPLFELLLVIPGHTKQINLNDSSSLPMPNVTPDDGIAQIP